MTYKGYTARYEVDPEAGVIHGEVLHLKDVITFSASEVRKLRAAFEESVDDYLEFCASRGEAPEKPYPGKVLLRMDPDLHRDIAIAASGQKQSVNAWMVNAIQGALKTRIQSDARPKQRRPKHAT
jgi:predicted HicB family RNase H-like nuclease